MIRFLLFAVALLPVCCAEAAPEFKPVVISLGDTFDVSGAREAEPLRKLVDNLKKHPKNQTFRLIWGSNAPNAGQGATALYDRRARTLKFYSDTQIGGMGNEEIAADIRHWMLSGVTETMLNKLARKHRGSPTASDGASYFTELIYYGARRRDLGSRQVLTPYGKARRNKRNN